MQPDRRVLAEFAGEGRFVLLSEGQASLLELCDGTRDVPALSRALECRRGTTASPDRVEETLRRLARVGLLAGGTAVRRRDFVGSLFVRELARLDPTPVLALVDRYTAAISGRVALVTTALSAVAASSTAATTAAPLVHDVGRLWAVHSLLAVLLLGIIASAVHELAHAIVARRHGCRVPRWGVLVLYVTLGFYADVSESWRCPRRERLAIAGAGLLANLAMGSVALITWSVTRGTVVAQPSLLFALVNTTLVVYNLNPFVRFDGYWLLSDMIRITSLRQKSFALLRHRVSRGAHPAPRLARRERRICAWYGPTALIATAAVVTWSTLVLMRIASEAPGAVGHYARALVPGAIAASVVKRAIAGRI